MTKYLISFPGAAMQLEPDEFVAAGEDSRAVIRQIKAAGAYVFGGGINEEIEPVTVAADGTVSGPTYPPFDGGYTVIDVATREDAVHWAQQIAISCRCPQELREFMYDPES